MAGNSIGIQSFVKQSLLNQLGKGLVKDLNRLVAENGSATGGEIDGELSADVTVLEDANGRLFNDVLGGLCYL